MRKKEAVLESVSIELYSNSRRATAVPNVVLHKLVFLATSLSLFADRFFIQHVLYLLCIVARFSEGQHISPSRLLRRDGGLAAEAWATKVSGVGKKRGILPFWAPHGAVPGLSDDFWHIYKAGRETIGFSREPNPREFNQAKVKQTARYDHFLQI